MSGDRSRCAQAIVHGLGAVVEPDDHLGRGEVCERAGLGFQQSYLVRCQAIGQGPPVQGGEASVVAEPVRQSHQRGNLILIDTLAVVSPRRKRKRDGTQHREVIVTPVLGRCAFCLVEQDQILLLRVPKRILPLLLVHLGGGAAGAGQPCSPRH